MCVCVHLRVLVCVLFESVRMCVYVLRVCVCACECKFAFVCMCVHSYRFKSLLLVFIPSFCLTLHFSHGINAMF